MNPSEWLTWSSKNLGSSAPDKTDKTRQNPARLDFCQDLSVLSGRSGLKILEIEAPETVPQVQSVAPTAGQEANTAETPKSCYFHGFDGEWWSRPDGTEVCARCHPNPSTPEGWIERLHFPDRPQYSAGTRDQKPKGRRRRIKTKETSLTGPRCPGCQGYGEDMGHLREHMLECWCLPETIEQAERRNPNPVGAGVMGSGQCESRKFERVSEVAARRGK